MKKHGRDECEESANGSALNHSLWASQVMQTISIILIYSEKIGVLPGTADARKIEILEPSDGGSNSQSKRSRCAIFDAVASRRRERVNIAR